MLENSKLQLNPSNIHSELVCKILRLEKFIIKVFYFNVGHIYILFQLEYFLAINQNF